MEKVITSLRKLNQKLYKLPLHGFIAIMWIWGVLNFHGPLIIWIESGLVSAILIAAYSFYKLGWRITLSKVSIRSGSLPLFQPVNTAAIFGPLTIPLFVLLKKYPVKP